VARIEHVASYHKIKQHFSIMQVNFKHYGKKIEDINLEMQNFLRVAPYKIGNTAVLFFKDNIRERQGFLDTTIDGWAENKTGIIKKAGGKMLIEKGNLLRGITQQVNGTKVMVYVIGVAAKYAEIHNTGGIITVTPKMRKFFWAKYYENSKKIVTLQNGKLSTKSVAINQIAEYYKNLALAKTLVIPKRRYIGNSATLNHEINNYLYDNLDKIFNQ
jgi:phage gpG-like protein